MTETPLRTRALHRERVRAALDLLAQGMDVRSIAAELDVTARQATRLLSAGIAELPAQDVEELRATSELRLDRLARVYGALLDSDDERTRLAAANGLRQVERDRANLLGTWQRPPKEED